MEFFFIPYPRAALHVRLENCYFFWLLLLFFMFLDLVLQPKHQQIFRKFQFIFKIARQACFIFSYVWSVYFYCIQAFVTDYYFLIFFFFAKLCSWESSHFGFKDFEDIVFFGSQKQFKYNYFFNFRNKD